LHTFDHPHRWGRLVEGPRKALQHVSFGAFEDDMPRFAGHLKQLRIDRLKPPPGEDELEQAISGKVAPQAALDSAVRRGNEILRKFEKANP